MKNFAKKYGEKLVTIAVGVGLLSTLNWDWNGIKAFISGAIIAFYAWTIFSTKEAD